MVLQVGRSQAYSTITNQCMNDIMDPSVPLHHEEIVPDAENSASHLMDGDPYFSPLPVSPLDYQMFIPLYSPISRGCHFQEGFPAEFRHVSALSSECGGRTPPSQIIISGDFEI